MKCAYQPAGLAPLFSLVVLIVPVVCAAQQAADARPNVILLMTDDQGYGDLACLGHPLLRTPNLDQLYNESIRLTNFQVSPTCSPTRAALLTGRYCDRVGVWHTIMGRSLLRASERTMADVFAAGGYRTGIFGKWHLGDNFPFRPQDRGFQESLVHKGGGVGNAQDYWGNDYFDDTYFRNGRPEKFRGYCTDVWFHEAMKFIEANKVRPFFCYLSTNAPHGPYRVPAKYAEPYKGKGVKPLTANYYGMLACIDENMGRLMHKLDELDLAENTILIFMTDNGATPAGRDGAVDFNAGMRGWKGSHYDGGHRVPFFIRWPNGGLVGGRDIGRLTAHIDVLPTLIDLCNLPKPDRVQFDGVSLRPLLFGNNANWPDRVLVTDNQRVDQLTKNRRPAVMTDRWRLINGNELYDISADPGQRNNIADLHRDVVQRLQAAYETWWTDVSRQADEYPRIIIGSEHENPTTLSSHDLHGQVVWNQGQVRRAQRCDGFWAVNVARDGQYKIELRRWPRELNQPITAGQPDGRALDVTEARLKIADFDKSKPIEHDATAASFVLPLKAGPTRMQAWFINAADDGQTFGVYYVDVTRLP